LVLVVLVEDVSMRSPAVRHLGVVVSAQDVGSAFEGMMADAPATLGVAVHLAHPGINAEAHGADECCLAEVRSET
jgi:hypothetical protein